jgi:hypothetical protein
MIDTRLPSGHITKVLRRKLDGITSQLKSFVRPPPAPAPAPQEDLYDDRAQRENARRRAMGQKQRELVLSHRVSRADLPLFVIRATGSLREQDAADYGWGAVARVVGVRDVPGDHLTLFKGAHEDGFVRALDAALTGLGAELGRMGAR